MHLSTLLADPAITVAGGDRDRTVLDLTDDSRRVAPGWLFIARVGHDTDGARFIGDAVQRGAVAVLTAPGVDVPARGPSGDSITHLVCNAPGAMVGELAARFFGHPARQLRLLGVTGTNGKTTTVYMIRHLLQALGRRCGMVSTVEIDDGKRVEPAALTTPGAIDLQRLFRRMVDHGCEYCAMECSSHALDQGRLDGLGFDVGVFTNLSGDHLDYHGSMEAYATAKAKLFQLVGTGYSVINFDDAYRRVMVEAGTGPIVPFGIDVDINETWALPRARRTAMMDALHGEAIHLDADGCDVSLNWPARWAEMHQRTRLPLPGRHNVSNLLGAIAAAGMVDRDPTAASLPPLEALAEATRSILAVPGRLERVTRADEPFTVLVDYAHTDDALRNVLQALRPLLADGAKLRVLFGCGGDRDRTKRPRMAQVACDLADAVWVTSDNPRTEAVDAIIADILTGVRNGAGEKVITNPDRRAAIEDIMASAGSGDIVLIAGKGHEDYQIIGTTRTDFDDRVEARVALDRLRETDSTE